jgi:HEAT repeat protein
MLWWMLRRLRSSNPDARRRAAAKLYKLRDARTVGALIAGLSDFNSEVRTLAARALGEIGLPRTVGPLMATLKDWNGDVRLAAMEALVKLGGASVEPLVTMLWDADSDVRNAASAALEALGWQPMDTVERARDAVARRERKPPRWGLRPSNHCSPCLIPGMLAGGRRWP